MPSPASPLARTLYLTLFVIGSAAPLLWFWPWLNAHGLDLAALARELFSTRVGGFFGLDVLCAAVALLVWMQLEHRRLPVRRAWLAALATCCIGVSSGLPLYLYLRQRTLDAAVTTS
ncbi:MAG: hypothetical protein DI597_03915 [Pseudoxanthomonas spadix]|nr:MAG: hypothetical protein DI597_03915 [Pseudoxanthomonas spadix]